MSAFPKSSVSATVYCVCLALFLGASVSAQTGGFPGAPGFGGEGSGPPGGAGGFGPVPGDPAAPPMAVPRIKPDGSVQLNLTDGSLLKGKLAETEELKLKSAFGELNVPVKKIAFIELGGPQNPAKVTLRNGDRLSGELVVEKLKLKADWGEIAIDAKHVKSITSTDLTHGYRTIKRAVREVVDGETRIRYVEEIVPASPYDAVPSGIPGMPGGPGYPALVPGGYPAGASPYGFPEDTPPPLGPPLEDCPGISPFEPEPAPSPSSPDPFGTR